MEEGEEERGRERKRERKREERSVRQAIWNGPVFFTYCEVPLLLIKWLYQFEYLCHHFIPLRVFEIVDATDQEGYKIALWVFVCWYI